MDGNRPKAVVGELGKRTFRNVELNGAPELPKGVVLNVMLAVCFDWRGHIRNINTEEKLGNVGQRNRFVDHAN